MSTRRIIRVLVLLLAYVSTGCAPGLKPPVEPLLPHEVRIESEFQSRLILYYVSGTGNNKGVLAAIRPFGRKTVSIAPALRGGPSRVMACLGRHSKLTEERRCVLINGDLRVRRGGSILTIFATSKLTGMVHD